MDESLLGAEISKSDPGIAGNISQEPVLSIIDSSNMARENSAFTKVAPSKQAWTTSGAVEDQNVQNVPLPMPPDGEESTASDINAVQSHLDENSAMVTTIPAGNIVDGFCLEREVLNNTETLNVGFKDHLSTSPVSGNIPPHNTPVIGTNKGEINLQDVQLALTQVMNCEIQDVRDEFDLHVDIENGYDYRRSISDVLPETEKEHDVKLRHHSGTVIKFNENYIRKIFCYTTIHTNEAI